MVLEPRLCFYPQGEQLARLYADDGGRVQWLDLDGNVVAPFVYDHVEALTDSYYLAVLAENQQVVLYDHDFRAADAMVWIAAHGKNHC